MYCFFRWLCLSSFLVLFFFFFFFFNDTATTEIYTLSLHDALPISLRAETETETIERALDVVITEHARNRLTVDRKSTRLNSSHGYISYAVFCLKKKNESAGAWVPSIPVFGRGTSCLTRHSVCARLK